MAAESALQLCCRFLIFLALVHGAVLKSDVGHRRSVRLLPDDICPCIVREKCPRVFGSRPEDELLGSFTPCQDPGSVRCCGVTTRVSFEHSVSSNDPKPSNHGARHSGEEGNAAKPAAPVILPGIIVSVPFKFPEYLQRENAAPAPMREGDKSMESYEDYASYENRGGEEAISYVKKDSEDQEYFDQGESNSAKTLRGGNTEDNISRIDAFLPPEHLDYSRVNKYNVRGGRGFQTITGSGVSRHGDISASKKVENISSSTSPSSGGKKTGSIVNSEDSSLSSDSVTGETLSHLQEGLVDSDGVDYSTERIEPLFNQPTQQFLNERFNRLKSSLMGSTVFENDQETSSQQKSAVSEESSNFEANSSTRLTLENEHEEHQEDVERLRAAAVDQKLGMGIHSRGLAGFENQDQVSDQDRSESIAKELKKVKENSSSNFMNVALTTGEDQNVETKVSLPVRRRRPIAAQNVTPNLKMGTRLRSKSRRVYGQRTRTFPQRQSSSVNTESPNVEKNTASNVQSMAKDTGHQLEDDASSDLLSASRRPTSVIRRPTTNRGSVVYRQRVQTSTSSQQQRNSVQRKTSNPEKNTAAKVQSITTSTGHLSEADSNSEDRVTTWRPVSRFRRPTSNRSSIIYARRKETSSQQRNNSAYKESTNAEENTSSKFQNVATTTEAILDGNVSTELVGTSRNTVPGVKRPTESRETVIYGEQKQTSPQRQRHLTTQDSSKVEINTSHNVESITANVEGVSGHDDNLDLLPARRIPVPARMRPTVNRGIIHNRQQHQTSSQQQSESAEKESSDVEENTSPNVETFTTNTEDMSDHGANSELDLTNQRSIPAIRISTLKDGTLLYGQQKQTESHQKSNSMTQESYEVEGRTSSGVQNTVNNAGARSQLDLEAAVVRRPTANRGSVAYGQQHRTSSQQENKSVTKESANVEEKTSSNVESITTNTEYLSGRDANSELNLTNHRPVPAIRISTLKDGTLLYGQQKQTESQQRSNSMTQESYEVEGRTSSGVQNTVNNAGARSQLDLEAAIVRRPTANRGSVAYGQQHRTSSQQENKSVTKESANVEEKTASNVESITTNTEYLSGRDANSELNLTNRRPIPAIKIPTLNQGSVVYGRQEQASSRQQINLMTQENSKVEENNSHSDVQSTINNTGAILNVDSEAAVLIRPIVNRDGIVNGQQQQTAFPQQSNSVSEVATNVDGKTSFNAESITTNSGYLSGHNANSELLTIDRRPIPPIRIPTFNEGSLVHGQQMQTTAQQYSNSITQESSAVEENASSSVHSMDTRTENQSERGANAELFVADRRPIPTIRIPTFNEYSTVHGQQQQTTSDQQSHSVIQESSKAKENTASDVQNAINNTGLSVDSEVAVVRPIVNRVSIIYAQQQQQQQISSQEQNKSVIEELAKVEENGASNVASITTNTGDQSGNGANSEFLAIDRRPIPPISIPILNEGGIVYGQQRQTSSQQESVHNSVLRDASRVEENTYSNDQSIITNTEDQSAQDANTRILLTGRSPFPAIRIPTINEYSIVHGEQQQSDSREQSHSTTQGTSKVEESTSSDVQSINTNVEDLSGYTANVDLLAIDRRPIPPIRIPTLNVGSIAYGQQKQTSPQQQSNFMTEDSSTVRENSSSNLQSITSNTGNILDVGSEAAAGRRPTSSRGNVVYGERGEMTAHQQSDSVEQQSTKVKENTSSDAQSFFTNTAAQPYDHMTSQIVEATSFGNTVSTQRIDTSGHEENDHTAINSNIEEALSHDYAGLQHVDTTTVDTATSGQHAEITSTHEKSESAEKKLSLNEATAEITTSHVHHLTIKDQTASYVQSEVDIHGADQEQSSIVNYETVPGSTIDSLFGQQTGSFTKQDDGVISSESASSAKKSTASTSNLWKVNTGKQSSRGEAIFTPIKTENVSSKLVNTNGKENSYVRHVANRAYVPVLVNAEFLRDRLVTTGVVGRDPVSGISHSDVWDSNTAPELLPLTCGDVLFGKRSQDGKTLICDIPQGSVPPIRFLGHDKTTINLDKLNSPILPGAVVPKRVQIRLETDEIRQPGPLNIGNVLFSSNTNNHRVQHNIGTNSMAAESHTEESSSISAVEPDENKGPRPVGNRFAMQRPMLVIAEQAVEPPRPAQMVHRGRSRYSTHQRQLISEIDRTSTVEEDEAAVGSKKFSGESLATSSDSSLEIRLPQESVSSSNSDEEITKSDFAVSSTDQYDAKRETEQRISGFHVLPSASTLPLPIEDVPEVTDSEEPRNIEIVEVVEEAPATLTKIGKMTSRNFYSAKKQPLKEIQVIMLKTAANKDADVKEAEFVVPEDYSRLAAFFYNRNSRQAKVFAPGVKKVTISPEKLSMTGRINIVGPLPRGYMDPVLFPEKQLAIDLPVNTGSRAFNSEEAYEKQITSRSTDSFKPSPVDPINWQ